MPTTLRSPLARKRTLTAAVLTAVLTAGGLTACGELEEPAIKEASAGGSSQDDKAGEQEKKAEQAGPLAAGDTAGYDSGLNITVSEAAPYTPDEFAAGHTEGNKAYRTTVTLENTGDKKIDISMIMISARAGEAGVNAEQIYDDTVGTGFEGRLLPSKKATAEFAFDVPADAGNLDIEVDLLDFTTEPAQWSLPL